MESMVKIMKKIMSRADQVGEDAHLSMLAYGVTLRGPGKLSLAEAVVHHKFKQCYRSSNTCLHNFECKQGDHDTAEAETG